MSDAYIPRFETQTDQNVPLPWTNCTFAAGAMLVDHWTYGRTRTNDVILRQASGVPTNLGANFAALQRAIKAALGFDLRYSEWSGTGNAQLSWQDLREHLARGGGAAVAGEYKRLRPHVNSLGQSLVRWQPNGDFGHAMFACDYRTDDGTVLLMDPLGHGGYVGDRARISALWDFIYKAHWRDSTTRIAAAWGFAGTRPLPVATNPPRTGSGCSFVVSLSGGRVYTVFDVSSRRVTNPSEIRPPAEGALFLTDVVNLPGGGNVGFRIVGGGFHGKTFIPGKSGDSWSVRANG